MPILTSQDVTSVYDFTGINPASAADHNNLVELAEPKDDTGGYGKGYNIRTVDQALDTPDVPDAVTITKWKRYVWVRKPHPTATSTDPILYAWNDDHALDATFKKWRPVILDTTDLETEIAAAQATADNAQTTANTAQASATAAQGVANNAQNVATAAQNTAAAADASANSAIADVTTLSSTVSGLSGTVATNKARVEALETATTVLTGAAQTFTVLHNLGQVPRYLRGVLVCIGVDATFAIGDEIDVTGVLDAADNRQNVFSIMANATNIYIAHRAVGGLFNVTNPYSGASANITTASFAFKLYYSKY